MLEQLLFFAPAAFIIAMTPGPSNFLGLSNGARLGLVPAWQGLTGRIIAFAIMIGMVAVGLGAILAASEMAFIVIKWVGVAYLIYIGIKLLRTREVKADVAPLKGIGWELARKEFLVAITNPKAVLIFTAFLPQFVRVGESPMEQLFWLGAVYLVAEWLAASVYIIAGRLMRLMSKKAAGGLFINRLSGGLMLAAAGLLASAKQA